MYFYKIYEYEESITLCHESEFTKEEFEKMCKEAPTCLNISYDVYNIVNYLIENYNFKNINYKATFFATKIN